MLRARPLPCCAVSPNVRRKLLIVAAAVTVWYLVVLFTWALQPLTDSVPVGADQNGVAASQTVECNTLFAAEPRPPGNLPVLTNLYYEYNRTACDAVQHDARIVFTLDTLVLVGVLGGVMYLTLRTRVRADAPLAIASAA